MAPIWKVKAATSSASSSTHIGKKKLQKIKIKKTRGAKKLLKLQKRKKIDSYLDELKSYCSSMIVLVDSLKSNLKGEDNNEPVPDPECSTTNLPAKDTQLSVMPKLDVLSDQNHHQQELHELGIDLSAFNNYGNSSPLDSICHTQHHATNFIQSAAVLFQMQSGMLTQQQITSQSIGNGYGSYQNQAVIQYGSMLPAITYNETPLDLRSETTLEKSGPQDGNTINDSTVDENTTDNNNDDYDKVLDLSPWTYHSNTTSSPGLSTNISVSEIGEDDEEERLSYISAPILGLNLDLDKSDAGSRIATSPAHSTKSVSANDKQTKRRRRRKPICYQAQKSKKVSTTRITCAKLGLSFPLSRLHMDFKAKSNGLDVAKEDGIFMTALLESLTAQVLGACTLSTRRPTGYQKSKYIDVGSLINAIKESFENSDELIQRLKEDEPEAFQ